MNSHLKSVLLDCSEETLYEICEMKNISMKMIDESVALIKEYFNKQPHLCKIDLDEGIVRRYLITNKYSVERVKAKLENYYCTKSAEEMFLNRDPLGEELSNAYTYTYCCVLPKLTPEKSRIIAIGLFNDNAEIYSAVQAMKVIFMTSDIRFKYDCFTSETFIWDAKYLQLGHIIKLSPHIKKIVSHIENCYGTKLAAIHIINAPPFAYNTISIIKSLLIGKIAKRINIHKNLEELHQHIPIEYLPSDLGGKLKSRQEITNMWIDAMRTPELKHWILENEKIASDESLNIKCNFYSQEYQSMPGTFRSLNID